MIKEPESKFVDYLSDVGPILYRYAVDHDGRRYACNTLTYASYLAEKFDTKVWNVVLNKNIEPHIGLCGHCEKYSKLHFVSGNRGSFPAKDDEFGCDECGSVYRIIDILMETGAYKVDEPKEF
jgi:hypothetical protein